MLSIVGFDQTNEVTQSEFAQQGILWLITVIPAVLIVISMLIIKQYTLTDEVIDKINMEIEARDSQE